MPQPIIVSGKVRSIVLLTINLGIYILLYWFTYFSHLLIQPTQTYREGGKLIELYSKEYYSSFESFNLQFLLLLLANVVIIAYLIYKKHRFSHLIYTVTLFALLLVGSIIINMFT